MARFGARARWRQWHGMALGIALALGVPTAADADAGSLTPLRQARTATLDLTESYRALRTLDDHGRPVEVPRALPTITLPFRSVIEALLRHAAVELQPDASADGDLRIVIDSRGATDGQLYDAAFGSRRIRELRYADAEITGTLRLIAGDVVVERRFGGTIAPLVSIIGVVDSGDFRRDPNYAPFRAAFEARDGFLDMLGAMVKEIWGEAPLRAALEDRDPLVREAARRNLE